MCDPGADYCEANRPSRCAADGLSSTPLGPVCSGALPHCQFAACEGVLFADYDGYARWPLPGTPGHAFSYTVNAAARTVVDNVTGLEWQREPAPGTQNWAAAESYCDSLSWGGRSDWRLPTRMELLSLVDYTRINPATDGGTFPGTTGDFWTASGRTGTANKWYVDFSTGRAAAQSASQGYNVRCVALASPQRPIPTSGHFFEVTSNTVLDHATGLEWQRGTSPNRQSQAASIGYCAGLTLDGKTGWRLPTVAELSSLVPSRKAAEPYIELTIFPSTQSSYYWSASPVSGSSGGWSVYFGNGGTVSHVVTSTGWARCVR